MDALILDRWQFGITTVYHFFFVPITIGLSWLVAFLQTKWQRTGDDQWLRFTKFFGKLFLINFAAGVVTGIVQEFQFGMNWSEYSRFVGDIFGAPLALEALIAFFLESTFIGLWIFGWDRLPRKIHLLTIYLTAIGSTLSAVFILAANCWMQNPVGAVYRNGRAELTDFGALFTNPFFLATFPHQMAASFMVAGGLMAAIGGWWLARNARNNTAVDRKLDSDAQKLQQGWRQVTKFGAWVLLAASLLVMGSGHPQAQVETQLQPAKLAASEGLFDSRTQAPFSVVAIFTADGSREVWSFDVPYVLSILAHNDPNAKVLGINDIRRDYQNQGFRAADGTRNELQVAYSAKVAALNVDPIPNVWVSYYAFRLMIGLGMLGTLFAVVILWNIRKREKYVKELYANAEEEFSMTPPGKWWDVMCIAMPLLPLFANSFGWILTEMGRQPWIVYGVLPVSIANSPTVGAGSVLFTMVLFTLLYAVIAVVVVKLFLTYIRKGLPDIAQPESLADNADAPLHFAY